MKFRNHLLCIYKHYWVSLADFVNTLWNRYTNENEGGAAVAKHPVPEFDLSEPLSVVLNHSSTPIEPQQIE